MEAELSSAVPGAILNEDSIACCSNVISEKQNDGGSPVKQLATALKELELSLNGPSKDHQVNGITNGHGLQGLQEVVQEQQAAVPVNLRPVGVPKSSAAHVRRAARHQYKKGSRERPMDEDEISQATSIFEMETEELKHLITLLKDPAPMSDSQITKLYREIEERVRTMKNIVSTFEKKKVCPTPAKTSVASLVKSSRELAEKSLADANHKASHSQPPGKKIARGFHSENQEVPPPKLADISEVPTVPKRRQIPPHCPACNSERRDSSSSALAVICNACLKTARRVRRRVETKGPSAIPVCSHSAPQDGCQRCRLNQIRVAWGVWRPREPFPVPFFV